MKQGGNICGEIKLKFIFLNKKFQILFFVNLFLKRNGSHLSFDVSFKFYFLNIIYSYRFAYSLEKSSK